MRPFIASEKWQQLLSASVLLNSSVDCILSHYLLRSRSCKMHLPLGVYSCHKVFHLQKKSRSLSIKIWISFDLNRMRNSQRTMKLLFTLLLYSIFSLSLMSHLMCFSSWEERLCRSFWQWKRAQVRLIK